MTSKLLRYECTVCDEEIQFINGTRPCILLIDKDATGADPRFCPYENGGDVPNWVLKEEVPQ
jgi:hypothetical protein